MCILPPIMFCLYVAWKICLLVQGGCHPCTGFVHHLVMCRAIWVIDRNAAALEECRCCSLLASVAPQAHSCSVTRVEKKAHGCGLQVLRADTPIFVGELESSVDRSWFRACGRHAPSARTCKVECCTTTWVGIFFSWHHGFQHS